MEIAKFEVRSKRISDDVVSLEVEYEDGNGASIYGTLKLKGVCENLVRRFVTALTVAIQGAFSQ